MKQVSILAIAVISVSLAQFGLSQSTAAPVKIPDSSTQAKHDLKAAKAKSTATQDAAYALAYQKGLPKS